MKWIVCAAFIAATLVGCAHTKEQTVTQQQAWAICSDAHALLYRHDGKYHCQPTHAGKVGPMYLVELGEVED